MFHASSFKKIATFTLMIMTLFSTTQSQAATAANSTANWRAFAPQGSGFYAQFPGQPIKKVNGAITQYHYLEQTPRGNYFYGIAMQTYSYAPADLDKALRAECDGYARGFEGQVVRTARTTNNGYTGLLARVESKTGSSIVAAWYVGNRVYCVAFATGKTVEMPDEARQFLNSFLLYRS